MDTSTPETAAVEIAPMPIEATVEEVAAWLSAEEGRPVSINEVRRVEFQALRKLRRAFAARGMGPRDLVLD